MKNLQKNLSLETLKIFWKHASKYRWQGFFVFFGIIGVTAITTYVPLLYRDLINLLSGPQDKTLLAKAFKIVYFIFFINLFKIALWRLAGFVNNYFQPRVMADITNSCYEYLQKHSYGFFVSSFIGSLVTKVKRYERAFERISDQIVFEFGRTILDSGMILVVIFWQFPSLALPIFLWAVVFIGFAYRYSLYKLPYDFQRAEADSQTTAQLADSMTNNINIKLFTNYEKENKKFFDVTNIQFKLRKKSWDLGTIGDLIQGLMMVFLELGIVYWAVNLWGKGLLKIGDITLIQVYLWRMFDKLWNIGRNIRDIFEAMADANEMTEMLLLPNEVLDKPNAKTLNVTKGKIEFKNVEFNYLEEKTVFKNFKLSIDAGQRIALIGPSGGGKSTIVKLLFRFMDIQSGSIEIDSQDISEVTQDSLRANISLVPQDPILFHRSLMENIRYGKPSASDEEVIEAAKKAHAHEFITKTSLGYETFVGERGVKLSGGERQRVAIARAILKNAPILVLDEATSSLDSESEHFIQQALKELMQNKTVIVIAHRLSTVMQMDKIVVLENGTVTEAGKHEELLKLEQGTYQKLWQIQAGGFNS
jgi:ATP-binding cassette, subfamily B, bacterial